MDPEGFEHRSLKIRQENRREEENGDEGAGDNPDCFYEFRPEVLLERGLPLWHDHHRRRQRCFDLPAKTLEFQKQ